MCFVGEPILKQNEMLGLEHHRHTPRKVNMEHNHGGLEDHVPFLMGDL